MTRMAWRLAVAVAVLFLVAGCPKPPPPPPAPDAGPADAGVAATPDLHVEVRYEAPDGGGMVPIPFVPGGPRPVIDPTQRIEISGNLGLKNYRVRLFDEADRALVSDDEVLGTPAELDYRIQLPSPLRTGRKYVLAVDAETGASMTDSAGRSQPDQRLEFLTSGEKEKPAAAAGKPAGKAKKHRH